MTLRQPNIERMLKLKLTGMVEGMKIQDTLPDVETLTFDDRLAMLLDHETAERDQRSYSALLRRAQLRVRADLQDVDCSAGRGLSRTFITTLGEGSWIRAGHNVTIVGKTGCGKTFLACALAHQACRQHRSVLYRRVPDLLSEFAELRGTPGHRKLLRCLARLNLLVLDDWGLETLSIEGRRDIYEIIQVRDQGKSTIVASQLPVEDWHETVGERTIADGILDRLAHNAYHLKIEGESMRKTAKPPPL